MTLRLIHKAPRFRGVNRAPASEPWRAIHRAADKRVPAMQRAFEEWARGLELRDGMVGFALRANEPGAAAVNAIDWDRARARLENALLPILKDTYYAGGRVGERTTKIEKQVFRTLIGAFDLLNPRAAVWAALHAADLVTLVTAQQMRTLRDIIVRAQAEGLSLRIQEAEILERLRLGIGLDDVRAGAVDRFVRTQLEAGVDPVTVQQRAEALRDRYLHQRAHTIARNETLAAANAGKVETWTQAREQGLIPPGTRKRRVVVKDKRTCKICEPMKNQEVDYDEPFTSPYDGSQTLFGAQHISCRCTEVLIFPEA
jgi:hypothetical protein